MKASPAQAHVEVADIIQCLTDNECEANRSLERIMERKVPTESLEDFLDLKNELIFSVIEVADGTNEIDTTAKQILRRNLARY